MAGGAGPVAHVFRNLFADIFRVGLAVTALQVADDAFESGIEGGLAAVAVVVMQADFFALRAVQDKFLVLGRQILEGLVHVDMVMLRHGFQHLPVIAGIAILADVIPFHGDQCAVTQGFLRVDHAIGVNFEFVAQPLAIRAGAMRGVEGEGARLDLRDADAMLRAGQVLGKVQVVSLIVVVSSSPD